MKIPKQDIAAALKPLGFQMQVDWDEVTFVRPNTTIARLFERVECVYVGLPQRGESSAIVLTRTLPYCELSV